MQTPSAPTLGRIVHFTCDTNAATKLNVLGGRKYNVGEKVAAIVTRPLDNHSCSLTLFPDAEEVLHIGNVPYSKGDQPGTWSWPEQMGAIQEAAA